MKPSPEDMRDLAAMCGLVLDDDEVETYSSDIERIAGQMAPFSPENTAEPYTPHTTPMQPAPDDVQVSASRADYPVQAPDTAQRLFRFAPLKTQKQDKA
ncbi:hypothetical protein GF324_07085 [bacterium]|nr:hypothetical protein [bacterium]